MLTVAMHVLLEHLTQPSLWLNGMEWAWLQGLQEPWNGVMHAGGVLADGLVPRQSAASLRTVFGAKVPLLQNILSSSLCKP